MQNLGLKLPNQSLVLNRRLYWKSWLRLLTQKVDCEEHLESYESKSKSYWTKLTLKIHVGLILLYFFDSDAFIFLFERLKLLKAESTVLWLLESNLRLHLILVRLQL